MAQTTAELIAQGQDPTTTLTVPEKERLEICEEIIRKGLNTFLEVGGALAEINDSRLYKETHDTFVQYCKEVWDLGKSRAYQQIDGYKTVQLLEEKMSTMVDKSEKESGADTKILPMNERQTRPLTKLKDPDDQVKAWGIVLRYLNENPDAKPTAALISKAVKEVRGSVVKRNIEKVKAEAPKTDLLSRQFKRQYQVLLDIVVAAKENRWKDCKKKEVVKHLKILADLAESDD